MADRLDSREPMGPPLSVLDDAPYKEWLRFILVGVLATFLTWLTYNIIYILMPFSPRATLSWITNYFPSVTITYNLHRKFTFRVIEGSYFSGLFRAYASYSGVAILTSGIHHYLVELHGMDHQLSWLVSTTSSVILNFILLKAFVFRS